VFIYLFFCSQLKIFSQFNLFIYISLPTDLSLTDNNFITKLKSNINMNGNVAVNVIYSFYLPIDVVTEKSIKFRF
jgi:hypothetical protein